MFFVSSDDAYSPQDFWSRFVQPRIAHIQSVSPLDSTNIVRDARRMLDDELAAMHLAMCNLRTRRNALSPISSLPAEVLAHVFQITVTACPPSTWSRHGRGWIPAVTHVCRHWRDTALLHPSLWGNIHHRLTLPWRKLMMTRAKSAPLTINLLFYNSEESAFITEHAFHTRELTLAARRINLQETCQSFASSAPILECLEICNMGEEAVMLPVNIFAGNTPSLRRITLQGVLFSWSGPIFRDLTHLHVTASDDEASLLIASEDNHLGSIESTSQCESLLNALARMPALRKLDLAYCIPSRPHHHTTRLLVTLSCLELLSLTGTLAACTGIIQHITISTSCTIILKCDTGDSQPIDGLVHFLNRHANRREMPTLHSLVISRIPAYIISSSPIYVYLWSTCKPRHTPDGQPLLTIQLTSSPTYLQSLESLCSALPLDDLRVLEVDLSYNEWPSNTWIDMFGRCRNVEHVSLKGTNVISFCRTLIRTRDKGPGTAQTVERLFFRHLKSLEVRNVDLLDMDNGYGQPLHILLATWLSRRQELLDGDKAFSRGEKACEVDNVDNRLERLQVTQCSVMDKYVWGLRAVTQNLVWDHHEVIYARIEETEESEESEDESVHDI